MSAKQKKQRVRCDDCDKSVWLNLDGTYPNHDHTSYRCDSYGRRILRTKKTERCERSGKRYAFHMGTFWCSKRDANGKGTEWTAKCRCGESWTGPGHDDVEAPWARHSIAAKAEIAA